MPLQGVCLVQTSSPTTFTFRNTVSLHMIYCAINIYSDNQKFQILINEILKYLLTYLLHDAESFLSS